MTVLALSWAALDLARSPGQLALSIVASVVLLAVVGGTAYKMTDGSRKDG